MKRHLIYSRKNHTSSQQAYISILLLNASILVMVACPDLYLLIYLSPIFSIAAFLMTLLVAWVANTHRIIVSDVQIKSICLIDDYLQVLVPRGISKRFKQDDFLNVDEATKADRTGLEPNAGAPK